MVRKEDVQVCEGKYLVYEENGKYWQFQLWDAPESKEDLEDAKQQFALILSISDRNEKDIETHMRLNNHDGVCEMY